MYFGLNPFGLAFGYNQPPPRPANHMQNNQQNQQFPNNNVPNQPNNQGFFNGFNNFINNNFMNPLFRNNQPNQPRRSPSPRPTFSRKNNKKSNEEHRGASVKKEEKPGENTGVFWKMKGNEAYQKGNYEQAITYYSKAIVLIIPLRK
jgi:tetratricopeptide (TPR) repeat protein